MLIWFLQLQLKKPQQSVMLFIFGSIFKLVLTVVELSTDYIQVEFEVIQL